MKKLIQAIGIAIISIAGGCNASFAQSWLQVGNTLQRQTLTSPADTNYRFSMGSPGFMYFYDKYQVDQLISGGSLTFTAPLVKTGNTVAGSFDSTPTSGSTDFINSGAIYTALQLYAPLAGANNWTGSSNNFSNGLQSSSGGNTTSIDPGEFQALNGGNGFYSRLNWNGLTFYNASNVDQFQIDSYNGNFNGSHSMTFQMEIESAHTPTNPNDLVRLTDLSGFGPGTITAVNGTANQITSATTGGVATLSTPSTFNPPGSVNLVGTGGAAFISTVAQSSAPATPASGTELLYSNSSNQWTLLGHNGFAASLTKSLLTASQVYSFPNSTGTFVDGGVINWPGTIYSTPTTATVTSGGVVTFAPALATQTANTFLAGPSSGSAATPAFRAIVANDIPTLNQNTTGQAGSVANAWTPGSTLTNTTGAATYNGSATGTYDLNQAYAFNFSGGPTFSNSTNSALFTGGQTQFNGNSSTSLIKLYNASTSGYTSIDIYNSSNVFEAAAGYANSTVANTAFQGVNYFFSANPYVFFSSTTNELWRSSTAGILMASTGGNFTKFNTTDETTNTESWSSGVSSNIFYTGVFAKGTGTVRAYQIGVQPSTSSTTLASGRVLTFNVTAGTSAGNFDFTNTSTSAVGSMITLNGAFTSSSALQNALSIQPTVNQSSTGTANGLYEALYEQGTGGVVNLLNLGTTTSASNGGSFTSKFRVSDAGNVTQAGSLAINQSPTAVSCSTSGTANFNETQQGSAFKMVVVTLSAALGTASYTYATAFTNTPVILTTSGLSASLVTTNGTLSITITGATSTGTLILMGN